MQQKATKTITKVTLFISDPPKLKYKTAGKMLVQTNPTTSDTWNDH